MANNRITLNMRAIEEYAERLDKLGGDLNKTVEEALKKSVEHVTPKIQQAMQKHRQTGNTANSIVTTSNVEWDGTLAKIKVGFNISDGGLPSIFLMYGTPRMRKDAKLYNAIYGAKTKKEVTEIQQEIFLKAIRKKMEG